MDVQQIFRSRTNLLKMLEARGMNVDSYRNFSRDDLKVMLHQSQVGKNYLQPEPGPLDFMLENRHKTQTYVKYRLDKVKAARAVENFIKNIYENFMSSDRNELILIIPEKSYSSDSFDNMLLNLYSQKKYYVQIIGLNQLINNIVDHIYVPQHSILSQKEKQELLDKYNLKDGDIPVIYRKDAISQYYGIYPGEVFKILRSSKTSGTYETYRICT